MARKNASRQPAQEEGAISASAAPRSRGRSKDEAQRARDAAAQAASETAALATMGGTMLLGVLAGTADAEQQREAGALLQVSDSRGASVRETEPEATVRAPLDPPPGPDGHGNFDPPRVELITPVAPPAHPDVSAHAATEDSQAPALATGDPAIAASGAAGSGGAADAIDLSAHAGTASAAEPAAIINSVLQPISDLVHSAVDLVSHVVGVLGDAAGHLLETASAITNTLTHELTGTLAGLTGSLGGIGHVLSGGADAAPPGNDHTEPMAGTMHPTPGNAGEADAPFPAVPVSASASSETPSGADAVPLLDSHPLVPEPIAPTHLDMTPLQLGFVGQSYADSADPHDGAFSALGVHGFV